MIFIFFIFFCGLGPKRISANKLERKNKLKHISDYPNTLYQILTQPFMRFSELRFTVNTVCY